MKKKKNEKLNLTLEYSYYQFLKRKALDEHLPVSTFVKKFLMDNLQIGKNKK